MGKGRGLAGVGIESKIGLVLKLEVVVEIAFVVAAAMMASMGWRKQQLQLAQYPRRSRKRQMAGVVWYYVV